MIKYEVGRPFPSHNRANGHETCHSETNSTLFDVLYYIPNPTIAEIKVWKSEKLRYGVYTNSDIPFFIIDFTKANWNFDVNTNVYKIIEGFRDEWLNSEGNIISLFLINANNNILEAKRTISITKETVDLIKDTLEAQTNTYDSIQAVDNKLISLLEIVPISEMMKRCKMISI